MDGGRVPQTPGLKLHQSMTPCPGLINAILYLGAAAGALLVGRPFMVNYGSFAVKQIGRIRGADSSWTALQI